MKRKLLLTSMLGLISINTYANDVFAHANQATGFAGQTAYVTDWHKVRLYNGSDHTVTWTYHYKLCVDNNIPCKQFDKTVTLNPHSGTPEGQWTNRMGLEMDHVWRFAGTHQITSTTWIDAGGGDPTKTTTDYNVITIY